MEKKITLANLFRALSVASATVTFYGFMYSKKVDEALKQIECERKVNKILNEKYNKLLESKINENELNSLITNEKIKTLMEEMNELKSKISNQKIFNKTDIENVNNSSNILEELKNIKETFNHSNNSLNAILNTVDKYINSKNNNNFSESFMTLIHDINNIIFNMSMSEQLAYFHVSGCFFILISLFSIISIFYGDFLITKLNLEVKYPKLGKFIKLRRKFQHFYILMDVIISSIILVLIMYINIRILML